MKKLIFASILITAIFIPIAVSEGQVMPVCSIIEETDTGKTNVNINKELEDYVVGVVAGEMPVNFPHEALKAQAVAARTYAVRQLQSNPNMKYEDIAQAYVSIDKMKEMWGNNFDEYYAKIKNNVYATAGEILEYNNEPILAAFCSTTNGYTEECQNVWTQDLPYLKSVKSEGDELSPYYSDSVTVPKKQFSSLFGSTDFTVTEKTNAGYVKSVNIGGNVYSGDRIRQIMGLRSTCFDIFNEGENIIFSTKGYGHGVGMSQYGACFMANNGDDYKTILAHYYTGTNLKNL